KKAVRGARPDGFRSWFIPSRMTALRWGSVARCWSRIVPLRRQMIWTAVVTAFFTLHHRHGPARELYRGRRDPAFRGSAQSNQTRRRLVKIIRVFGPTATAVCLALASASVPLLAPAPAVA